MAGVKFYHEKINLFQRVYQMQTTNLPFLFFQIFYKKIMEMSFFHLTASQTHFPWYTREQAAILETKSNRSLALFKMILYVETISSQLIRNLMIQIRNTN